jgi:hypothetical protein
LFSLGEKGFHSAAHRFFEASRRNAIVGFIKRRQMVHPLPEGEGRVRGKVIAESTMIVVYYFAFR